MNGRKLARIIESYVPTFFQHSTRLSEYNEDRERLATAIQDELDMMIAPDEYELGETVSRLRSLAGSFEELNYDTVIGGDHLTTLASRLEYRADTYQEQGDDYDDNDDATEIDEPIKATPSTLQHFLRTFDPNSRPYSDATRDVNTSPPCGYGQARIRYQL